MERQVHRRGHVVPDHVLISHTNVETMNAVIHTTHTDQSHSTIKEILRNTSVPNRFRLKARANAIRPLMKPGDMVVKWCTACNKRFVIRAANRRSITNIDEFVSNSFIKEYCLGCKDKDLSHAQYRYRFWATLQDEPDGPTLPCQLEHHCIVGSDLTSPFDKPSNQIM